MGRGSGRHSTDKITTADGDVDNVVFDLGHLVIEPAGSSRISFMRSPMLCSVRVRASASSGGGRNTTRAPASMTPPVRDFGRHDEVFERGRAISASCQLGPCACEML